MHSSERRDFPFIDSKFQFRYIEDVQVDFKSVKFASKTVQFDEKWHKLSNLKWPLDLNSTSNSPILSQKEKKKQDTPFFPLVYGTPPYERDSL